jgi:hypothetical protein
MPPARNKFAVGHFMSTNSLAEEKAKLSLEIKNGQQQIRRLKIKVGFSQQYEYDIMLLVIHHH